MADEEPFDDPSDAEPEITKKMDKEFWAAWKATYPNIETDAQNINYNDLLDKFRTALLGNAGPMAVRLRGATTYGCSIGLLPGLWPAGAFVAR